MYSTTQNMSNGRLINNDLLTSINDTSTELMINSACNWKKLSGKVIHYMSKKEGMRRRRGGGGADSRRGALERVDHKKMAEFERPRSVIIASLEVMEFPETPWVK